MRRPREQAGQTDLNLLAVPVLDQERRFLRIVTIDDVIDAIVAESTEYLQRFGGVAGTEGPYRLFAFGWLSLLPAA
jgi:magnesium transporter